ncbi:MAG: MATE family efflux transporter [bacterium]
MKKNREEIFENLKPSKAVRELALPTIIGMLVMAFYNIVDTYFIAQTNDPVQVAAVSLALPVFMILMSLGNLFGIGASSNVSRNLGAKNLDVIKNITSTAFYCAIFIGILFTGMTLVGMDGLITLLGATETNANFVSGYLTLIVIGAPFIITSSTLTHIIRSEGNAKIAMFGMLLSTVVNIACDPIFIFTLDMGVIGAALATMIANIVSTIFYIVAILKNKNTMINLSIKNICIKNKVLTNIVAIGTPASVTSLLTSVSTIVYNSYLNPYGSEALAAMGIVMKISLIYTMVFMGIATGIQPLLGYCYGSKKIERFKEILFYALKVAVFIGLIFLVVIYTISGNIISGFIDDKLIITYGTQMLRAQIVTTPIVGILYITMSTMQATGKSLQAMILSVSRQGIAFIPIIFILANTLGFEGLIWAQPLADIITLCLSIIILIILFKSFAKEDIVG